MEPCAPLPATPRDWMRCAIEVDQLHLRTDKEEGIICDAPCGHLHGEAVGAGRADKTMTLEGLTSRWMKPALCMASSSRSNPTNIATTRAGYVSCRPCCRSWTAVFADVLAHHERSAVAVLEGVEDVHQVRVPICGVPGFPLRRRTASARFSPVCVTVLMATVRSSSLSCALKTSPAA